MIDTPALQHVFRRLPGRDRGARRAEVDHVGNRSILDGLDTRRAGVGAWEQLSPHSLRHSAITFALDAGASLRDVQDYAGHKDPRTTRRYDHSRDSLDRNAAYTVAVYLA